MIPTTESPSESTGSTPPPPGPADRSATDAPETRLVRSTPRSAKWALGGLTVLGLGYVWAVDPDKPNLVPACAFKALTGIDCPGCGGTRAVHALLHGDIPNALNHNALVVATLLIAVVWLAWNRLAPRLGGKKLRFSPGLPLAIVLMASITAFWIVRNLPWSPLSWLGSGN